MIKLNTVHYPLIKDVNIPKEFSLDILKNNELYLEMETKFLKKFSFSTLKTFSFNKDGFLSLLFELKNKGTIAICLGETNALIEAGKFYESLGFDISWIGLNKSGQINFDDIKNLDVDFLFISSSIMDTFVKIDLENIKKLTKASIISNATIEASTKSDVLYFDPYKLTGFNTSGVLLSNELFVKQTIGYTDNISVYQIFDALNTQSFNSTLKNKFKKSLEDVFCEDIYFFVDSESTLDFTLHFALKDIKARELIRTLALDEIYITNGEGCSLGLSQPSRIIQAMGYEKEISRNGISLSFCEEIDAENIEKACKLMYKRYRQIKVLR
jgi:cysteine sulfinate desulfinase/cysteine desulfurase-like protein